VIQISEDCCSGCPLKSSCQLDNKAGVTRTITIVSEKHRQARAANLSRLRNVKGKEIYRRRKAIVEPVFGNIKSNKGMRILVKGVRKVDLWWKMAATAHNLEKIVRSMAV
jgi:transposase